MLKYVALGALLLFLLTLMPSHASLSLNMHIVPLQSQSCSLLSPSEIRTAYGFNSLYNDGLNGAGSSVAIVVARGDPSLLPDVNAFDSYYSLPALINGSNLLISYPYGTPSAPEQNWTMETALDVEVVHALSPGAKIYLVIAPNSSAVFDALNYTVTHLAVQTISISWGSSELEYDSNSINYYNSILADARAKGITIFVASGDSGAYNSQSSLNVNFPASSPYVVSVGGTVLSTGISGSYSGETAWNGSGGGESQFFFKPQYQPNSSSYRMVPDVSFNAGSAVCVYANSSWTGLIGTSVAAPSWASLDAIFTQKIGGGTDSFARDLYSAFYSDGSLGFNLISSGCNGYYCANGGYSMVTGIGSPKAYSLIQVLAKASDSVSFSSNVQGAVLSVNGVNHTLPATINFSFGEKVNLIAYPPSSTPSSGFVFGDYSGDVNSYNSSSSFFVTAPGTVAVNFKTEFRVRVFNENGSINASELLTNDSSFNLRAPLYYNSSSVRYTLVGFRFDNGPLVYKNAYNFSVLAPFNVTFVLNLARADTVVIYGAPVSAVANVSLVKYTPLSDLVATYNASVQDGTVLFPVSGTSINVLSSVFYYNGSRYINMRSSVAAGNSVFIDFFVEVLYKLSFISGIGDPVYPKNVTVESYGIVQSFNDSSVWGAPSYNFSILKVSQNGFSLLEAPIRVNSSVINSGIKLGVFDVHPTVYIDFGIPVSFSNVMLTIRNVSVANRTNFLGTTSFYNIPQTPYNLTVSAYGSTYTFSGLTSADPTITIYPLLYQLYIAVAVIGLIILILIVLELKHKL